MSLFGFDALFVQEPFRFPSVWRIQAPLTRKPPFPLHAQRAEPVARLDEFTTDTALALEDGTNHAARSRSRWSLMTYASTSETR
jgi:hypothetical protein